MRNGCLRLQRLSACSAIGAESPKRIGEGLPRLGLRAPISRTSLRELEVTALT
jgi:hypothetical protein